MSRAGAGGKGMVSVGDANVGSLPILLTFCQTATLADSVADRSGIPSTGRWMQDDQEFRLILGYNREFKTSLCYIRSVSQKPRRERRVIFPRAWDGDRVWRGGSVVKRD